MFCRTTCPKCNHYSRFEILQVRGDVASVIAEHFVEYEWDTYHFNKFSLICSCSNCENFESGQVVCAAEKSNITEFECFLDENNELHETDKVFINLDVPTITPQQFTSSPSVSNANYLYSQAEKCYKLHAWDTVVIICRKIIDLKSIEMWKQKFTSKPHSNLNTRVKNTHR
ncbi:hypothetical protein J7H92_004491 [Vibrio parahaemolyticus]|nr:hypothetical protein [Vibrio parahaemolyticus]